MGTITAELIGLAQTAIAGMSTGDPKIDQDKWRAANGGELPSEKFIALYKAAHGTTELPKPISTFGHDAAWYITDNNQLSLVVDNPDAQVKITESALTIFNGSTIRSTKFGPAINPLTAGIMYLQLPDSNNVVVDMKDFSRQPAQPEERVHLPLVIARGSAVIDLSEQTEGLSLIAQSQPLTLKSPASLVEKMSVSTDAEDNKQLSIFAKPQDGKYGALPQTTNVTIDARSSLDVQIIGRTAAGGIVTRTIPLQSPTGALVSGLSDDTATDLLHNAAIGLRQEVERLDQEDRGVKK